MLLWIWPLRPVPQLGKENKEAWRKCLGLRNKIDLTSVKGHLEHGSINVTSCYNWVFCLRLSLIILWMGDRKEKHPKEQPALLCLAPLLFWADKAERKENIFHCILLFFQILRSVNCQALSNPTKSICKLSLILSGNLQAVYPLPYWKGH